ncbi:MAG: response regulator [Desulfobacula sp.]|uniref:CBS domain-containing protein n=1 Tax=Desulfobacula sp. TaxID=2593537 RepID=UPI0025C13304|nr:response regulator [Desulfobacula sp.]MCD4722863.1 response regulator [Desulfobacula sp.]
MTKKIKVLIIDDEERFCTTTSKLLTKKGFETKVAHNAEQALNILNHTPQDVIVLDIQMPGMDGLSALTEIKKIAPETKVIMLTGYGSKHSALRALVREAFDYLKKPCDIDMLALRIHDAYTEKHNGFKFDDKKAINIMTRTSAQTTISADLTLLDAVKKMETNHMFLLVLDEANLPVGGLTIMDFLKAARPDYIAEDMASTPNTYQFSPVFWDGLFYDRMKEIRDIKIREIMSKLPPVINENANLLEVADLMYKEQKNLLLVKGIIKATGIIRDQDLFLEMAHTILK